MFPELFFNQIAPKNWISKVGLKMKHQKKQVCEARTQKHCFFQDETLTITNESHSFATFSAAPVGELGRWVHLFPQRETSTVQGGSNYSFTGLFGPATNLEEMLKEYEQTVFFRDSITVGLDRLRLKWNLKIIISLSLVGIIFWIGRNWRSWTYSGGKQSPTREVQEHMCFRAELNRTRWQIGIKTPCRPWWVIGLFACVCSLTCRDWEGSSFAAKAIQHLEQLSGRVFQNSFTVG